MDDVVTMKPESQPARMAKPSRELDEGAIKTLPLARLALTHA